MSWYYISVVEKGPERFHSFKMNEMHKGAHSHLARVAADAGQKKAHPKQLCQVLIRDSDWRGGHQGSKLTDDTGQLLMEEGGGSDARPRPCLAHCSVTLVRCPRRSSHRRFPSKKKLPFPPIQLRCRALLWRLCVIKINTWLCNAHMYNSQNKP